MDCDVTRRISCQLDRIADALTGFDGLAFATQVLATFLGLIVPVLIAYFVFRGERRVRQAERRDDAFVKVIDSMTQYSQDLWQHEVALKASRVAGIGNSASNQGQFDPPPPTLDRVEQAIAAAKVLLRSPDDMETLDSAWAVVRATRELDGWASISGTMSVAAAAIADVARVK